MNDKYKALLFDTFSLKRIAAASMTGWCETFAGGISTHDLSISKVLVIVKLLVTLQNI